MNLGKIGKQLRREATANPKKAGLLGLLGLVALYFWAPLLLGGASGDNSKNIPPPAVPPTGTSVAGSLEIPMLPTEAAKCKETTFSPPPWQDLVRAMDKDPRTKPAGSLDPKCNPFRIAKVVPVEATKETPKPAVAMVAITPKAAGLALYSTILGPKHSVARINGKTYARGDTIEVATNSSGKIGFTLVEIGTKSAVLERLGKTYELKIESLYAGH